jgi:uncharacterized membrane protein YdcZ (DUF606 family)
VADHREKSALVTRPKIEYLPIALVLLLVYAGSVCWQFNWSPWDDFLSYAVYPLRMIETGSLDDPFNLRRILTFGSYSFLQALIVPSGWPWTAFQMDIGLGNLLIALLIIPLVRRWGGSAWVGSLFALFAVMIPLGRDNLMCSASGVAMFLALFRTLHLRSACERPTKDRLDWVVGGIAAALATLRPQFLAVVGIIVLTCELMWGISRKSTVKECLFSCCRTTAGGLIVLLPWSYALYRSSGTFLYPIMRGNDHGNMNYYSQSMTPFEIIRFVVGLFLLPKMALIVLTGLLTFWRKKTEAIALWTGGVGGAVVIASKVTLFGYADITRYTVPPLVAAAVIGLAGFEREPAGSILRFLVRAVTTLACVVLLALNCLSPTGLFRCSFQSLISGAVHGSTSYPQKSQAEYQQAQSLVPAGDHILSMSRLPFMFDLSRNTIDTVDIPGSTSPGPGIPYYQGPLALKKYLLGQSINWIIMEDFNRSKDMYLRQNWLSAHDTKASLSERIRPFFLDIMDNFDSIARATPHNRQVGNLRVVPLK